MPETTKEAIYNLWAPANSPWSPWVKPVLFAWMEGSGPPLSQATASPDVSWAPLARGETAVVLDLPREEGVLMGLELAKRGYRPVPLYNSVPKPIPPNPLSPEQPLDDPSSVVEVAPILHAIWRGTFAISQQTLRPEAPPAFLLDANRRTGRMAPSMGSFDNRSVSFTTDFPSALFLRSHGIQRTILVHRSGDQPQADLAHTLRRWQEGGVAIELKRLDMDGPPQPCQVTKPSWFGFLWYRIAASLGLKRHALGGFGGSLLPASGG